MIRNERGKMVFTSLHSPRPGRVRIAAITALVVMGLLLDQAIAPLVCRLVDKGSTAAAPTISPHPPSYGTLPDAAVPPVNDPTGEPKDSGAADFCRVCIVIAHEGQRRAGPPLPYPSYRSIARSSAPGTNFSRQVVVDSISARGPPA